MVMDVLYRLAFIFSLIACPTVGRALSPLCPAPKDHAYMSEYKAEAERALKILDDSVLISQVLQTSLHDDFLIRVAQAVVLPEISQFSYIEDVLMKEPFKPLYIDYEVDRVSFGLLQMRPNFAVDVEQRLQEHPQLARQFSDLCSYGVKEPEQIRKRRIERLENLRYQTRYLAAFMLLAQERIKRWGITSPQLQVRYYATLYNGGLKLDQNDVKLLFDKKQFPHGKITQYNYSSIALEFFEYLSNR